jgi:hypothetical protein
VDNIDVVVSDDIVLDGWDLARTSGHPAQAITQATRTLGFSLTGEQTTRETHRESTYVQAGRRKMIRKTPHIPNSRLMLPCYRHSRREERMVCTREPVGNKEEAWRPSDAGDDRDLFPFFDLRLGIFPLRARLSPVPGSLNGDSTHSLVPMTAAVV